MATVAAQNINPASSDDIPQWKKDLIARLRTQNRKSEERLWIDHHPAHHHISLQNQHPHPRTDLVISPENGFSNSKDLDSTGSSDSEDLHYGPGIVNRLRNKYLSLALRESNSRPTILRKATSLENLLDDNGGDEGEKEGRRFARRNAGNDGGNRYRSSNRRQEIKRARSVEVISRTNHEEELSLTSSVTAKINNRQSLHEDMLVQANETKPVIIENTRQTYKKSIAIENGNEDTSDKYNGKRINRPKRIPPLLNEREKPPVDVVKHAKMIFEKRPETRTKKPQHTGEVAAKVDSFNDIIVKTKVALKSTKPPVKSTKPVLSDKRSNTHHNNHHHHAKPVAKPVILSEEIITKPKTLDVKSPKQETKGLNSLPSPIPDVSRVDIKSSDRSDHRNNSSSLCETPDLILTSSPLPKITSPTYRKRTTENFIKEERNRAFSTHIEATNKFISPISSPTYMKPNTLNFNREELDSLSFKMISPITQSNITTGSATSVFNFINSQVDQRHLPASLKNNGEHQKSLTISESNGFGKIKMGVSAFEMEKNMKNNSSLVRLSGEDGVVEEDVVGIKNNVGSRSPNISSSTVEKTISSLFENLSCKSALTTPTTNSETTNDVDQNKLQQDVIELEIIEEKITVQEKIALKPVQTSKNSASVSAVADSSEKDKQPVKVVVVPKKTKPRQEEATITVFNFTSRKDVPDYISNDTSRTPSRPVIPRPDEPGITLLPEALPGYFTEFREWQEDELIRSLEARPPSPCDVTFINDNILIDGKSSLIQKTSKRVKLKISFVDDAEIYEYPSETSMLLEDSTLPTLGSPAQVGHTIPALSGSSLATYTPKTMEDFQLGITKSFQEPPPSPKSDMEQQTQNESSPVEVLLEEIEKPILFSSGGTSDMLF